MTLRPSLPKQTTSSLIDLVITQLSKTIVPIHTSFLPIIQMSKSELFTLRTFKPSIWMTLTNRCLDLTLPDWLLRVWSSRSRTSSAFVYRHSIPEGLLVLTTTLVTAQERVSENSPLKNITDTWDVSKGSCPENLFFSIRVSIVK